MQTKQSFLKINCIAFYNEMIVYFETKFNYYQLRVKKWMRLQQQWTK